MPELYSDTAHTLSRFREIGPERLPEFLRAGYKQRHVFPHRIYHFPKPGPDGYELATRMCGSCDLESLWEIVLYGDAALLEEFPRELFFDDALLWHRQQFGRPGQVAAVDVVLDGERLYSMAHQSDLVQRVSRRREHKTRIEKRFKGWHYMLLNALVDFAREHDVRLLQVPTADLALRNTDRNRTVQRTLFDRLYDRNVNELFPARRAGDWWVIEIDRVRDQIVVPEKRVEEARREKTICVCHDVERGLGHEQASAERAAAQDDSFARALTEMLGVEREVGVRATYNVVGTLLAEVGGEIQAGGHCIAFHSYDHTVPRASKWRRSRGSNQLARCRQVDYRIKGYRPPQSRITPELSDELLALHNFEWIASSSRSLGMTRPEMSRGLVRIPIAFDDFDLFRGRVTYKEWERKALERLATTDFVAFGLHDCYAGLWLPEYEKFLQRISSLGHLETLDDVAARVTLENAA